MMSVFSNTGSIVLEQPLTNIEKHSVVTESVSVLNSSNNQLQVKFTAVLQSFNVLNRNGRIYPPEKMEQAVKAVMEYVQNKELLGELGHPENVVTPERLFVIHPQHVSHRIEKMWLEGNLLYGEVVTTGPWGPHLAQMILDGNNVGFSGRIYVSKWERDPSSGAMVVAPDAIVRIITYDAVIIPSHREAYTQRETVTVTRESFEHVATSIARYCTEKGCLVTQEGTLVAPTISDLILSASDSHIPRYKPFTQITLKGGQ